MEIIISITPRSDLEIENKKKFFSFFGENVLSPSFENTKI